MTWWRRYWFEPGGRTAAAVLRIAIAISALMMMALLHEGRAGHPGSYAQDHYHALGILKLLPYQPGAATIQVLWGLAVVGGVAMLVGFRTRLATALTAIPLLALASYSYSFRESWSHDYNPPLLALLAFLGARGGDRWSVDAWWRARRGTPGPAADYPYTWSVRLVQLALAMVMVSACFSKLLSGWMTLDWALSDNLRHQIMVRFDLAGLPRTPLAEWLVHEPVRWKTAAMLNLVAQLAPLFACIFVRRPLVRALGGAIFLTEVIGLDLVMGFWNPHWFALTAAFIDWDWLVARLRRRPHARAAQAPVLPARAVRGFVAAFVAFDLVIAFWHWPLIDQKLKAYPFSSFPMFSSIRARPPYGEHRLYEMIDARVDVECDPPVHAPFQRWLDHYPTEAMLAARTPQALRAELERFRAAAHAAFPEFTFRVVRAVLRSTQALPYPAPARFDRVDVATIGELTEDGAFRSALGGAPSGYYLAGDHVERPGPAAVPDDAYPLARLDGRWFLVQPPND